MRGEQRPTVRRRVLGSNLRRLREDAGLYAEHAAEHLGCDTSKISRIESGRSGIRQIDLKALLDLYKVKNKTEREGWLSVSREGRHQRWWRDFEDQLPQDFLDLVGLEEDVSLCRGFEPGLIPGLFQTPRYAEAVIKGGTPGPLDEEEKAKLRVRMERQKVVTETEDPMSVWVVLGEAALRQRYGGCETLAEQLDHLTKLAQLPQVTLQVLPFATGAYPGGPYPFSIYRFPQPSSMEVVVLESHTSQLYLEVPKDTRYYGEVFDHLRAAALGAMESQSLIQEISEEIRR